MFVDSHCHLTFPQLQAQLGSIRDGMRQARVAGALCICTALEEFDAVHAMALAFDNFWASVGVHPDEEDAREPTLGELVELASRPKVVAIGETGLDYFRLAGRTTDDMEWQRERFRVHVRASLASGKPLVIHTRSASADTLALLREEGACDGVFHCFTETVEVARAALDMGFDISVSGILTFKAAVELKEVARFVPIERCLVETDSPFLAPVPFRGKTNTPALVPHVAAMLAELKGMAIGDVAAATTANFERLFGVAVPRCEAEPAH